jgi:hypothetical protein
MQFAAAIHEAARRIDEASSVFRFKARQTTDEYDALGAHWTDSRSKLFNQHFLQPQRDAMEDGERLCRRYADLASSAKSSAQAAESEITAFFAVEEEFESVATELARAAEIAAQLSRLALSDAQSLITEVQGIDAMLAAAAQDSN